MSNPYNPYPFSSSDATSVPISRVSEVEDEKTEDNQLLQQIVSFSPFQMEKQKKQNIREVPSLCRILRASGTLQRLKCNPNSGKRFGAVLYLVKDEKYFLILVPSNIKSLGSGSVKLNLDILKSAKIYPNEPNSLHLVFRDKGEVAIQFRFKELFLYFQKALKASYFYFHPEELLKLEQKRKELEKKAAMNNSSQDGLFGLLKTTWNSIFGSNELPFNKVHAGKWKVSEFRQFLEHEYIQHPRKHPPKSLIHYLNANNNRGWNVLKNYIQTGNTVYDLRGEIERYETMGKCSSDMKKVFKDPVFLERLRCGLDRIKEDGKYNILYSNVLIKRLGGLEKGGLLKKIENDLNIYRRYWWDARELRDEILSLLLFKKSLSEIIREIEGFFVQECKKRARKEIEEEEEENEGEGENEKKKKKKRENESGVTPEIFRDTILTFKNDYGIDLPGMSFFVYIRNEQNKLIFKREEAILEFDNLKLKKREITLKIHGKDTELEQLNSRRTNFENRLELIRDKKPNLVPQMNEYISKINIQISSLEDEIHGFKEELSEIDQRYSESVGSVLSDWDQKINDCIPELQMERRVGFIGSSYRREAIMNYFRMELERVSKKGMVEFVIKLVLSVIRNNQVQSQTSKWEQRAMKIIDPLLRPSFYKWGTLHSSTLLSSVGIHWFSNGLVFTNQFSMGEKYEEVCAIDAFCPLIVDFQNTVKKIQSLAEEIVHYNAFYKYAPYSFFGGKNSVKKNCQEFTEALIRKLGGTPYFQIVRAYFSRVKEIIVNEGKYGTTKADDLRFLEVSERFESKFKSIVKNQRRKKFLMNSQNRRIYFRSHKDLDDFYNLLLEVDSQITIHFPGEVQLLKGFDRAFWLRVKNEPENPKVASENCPFL